MVIQNVQQNENLCLCIITQNIIAAQALLEKRLDKARKENKRNNKSWKTEIVNLTQEYNE